MNGMAQGAEVSKQTDMMKALDDLSGRHSMIESRITRLAQKLELVLRPEGPVAVDKQGEGPPSSLVVNTLRNATIFMSVQCSRLDDLIDRLST